MTMPRWWSERRFGLFVDATPASVPGWAPIGADAADYRNLLGEDDEISASHKPLVEVLAHHRDRWGHVETFDDFVPLLTYERFDADDWARLVSESGANYSIVVAKHHDGWTWWDAPGSTRPLTEDGPRRDVVSEYAAACARRDIALGTFLSLADRDTPRRASTRHLDEPLRPQVVDLVERHGSALLWVQDPGDGSADDTLTNGLRALVRSIDPEIVIDIAGSVASNPAEIHGREVRTLNGRPPAGITGGSWQFVRGIGPSMGYNRAERPEHRLTAREIIALYTEIVAKGGNLVLAVGPDPDGTIAQAQREPLLRAGRWIDRYGSTIAAGAPWSAWGDEAVRYLRAEDGLLAVDVAGHGTFAELRPDAWNVTGVRLVDRVDDGGTADSSTRLDWHQDEVGLHVHRPQSSPDRAAVDDVDAIDVAVYQITIEVAVRPDELFRSSTPAPIALEPLVTHAVAGEIVQLGDGVYVGPVRIPPGVVVRGLGQDRTTIAHGGVTGCSDDRRPTVEVGPDARLEHVSVTGGAATGEGPGPTRDRAPTVVAVSGDAATLLGCSVEGVVRVDADDVLLRAVTAAGLVGTESDRLHVSRCELVGDPDQVGIDLCGGGGQLIDSSRLGGHLCSLRLTETTGSTVRGNTITGRWWGVHLDHCESAHVHGNRISWTMRAVDVDGGTQAIVDGNAVIDGDSGCVVQDGASDCEVYGNHWDRCRVGLLAWNAVALHHQDNIVGSLHEPDSALVTGP